MKDNQVVACPPWPSICSRGGAASLATMSMHRLQLVQPTTGLQRKAVTCKGTEIAADHTPDKATRRGQSRPWRQQVTQHIGYGTGHTAAEAATQPPTPPSGRSKHTKHSTGEQPPTSKPRVLRDQAQQQVQAQQQPRPQRQQQQPSQQRTQPHVQQVQQQQQGGKQPGAVLQEQAQVADARKQSGSADQHGAVLRDGTPSKQLQGGSGSPRPRTAHRRQSHTSSHSKTYAKLVVKLSAISKQGGLARSRQVGSESGDIDQLCIGLQQALQEGWGLKPVALATHATAISRVQQQAPDTQLQQAVSKTQQALFSYLLKSGLEGFDLVQLSMLLQAAARVRVAGPQVQQLLTAVMQQLGQLGTEPWSDRQSGACSPLTVSATLRAFATAGYEGDVQPLVAAVNAAVKAGVMDTGNAQAWSSTLWATAQLGIPAADMQLVWDQGWGFLDTQLSQQQDSHAVQHSLPDVSAGQVHSSMHKMQGSVNAPTGSVLIPQTVSNIVWAAAKTGYQPPASSVARVLIKAVDSGVMSSANLQEWSNTYWAVAKMGVPASPDMQRVWETGISSVATAVTMHSAAVHPGSKGFKSKSSSGKAMPRQHQVGPGDMQAVSNIMWAAATAPSWFDPQGQLAAQLASIISNCCTSALVGGASSHAWSNILWGAAKLGVKLSEHEHAAIAAALNSVAAAGRLDDGTAQAWACILWGATQLGIYAAAIQPVWRVAGPLVAVAISNSQCSATSAMMAFDAAASCQWSRVYADWLEALVRTEGGKQLLRAADVGQLCGMLCGLPSMYSSMNSRDDKRLVIAAASAFVQLLAKEVGAWQSQVHHHNMASGELVAAVAAMAQLRLFHPTLMSVALQQQLAQQCQAQDPNTSISSSEPAMLSKKRLQNGSSSKLTVTLLMAAARTLAGIHHSQQQHLPNADLLASSKSLHLRSHKSPSTNRSRPPANTETASARNSDDKALSVQEVDSRLQDAVRLMGTLQGGQFNEWDEQTLSNLLWVYAVLLPHAQAAGQELQEACGHAATAALAECVHRGPKAFCEVELSQIFTAHLEAVESEPQGRVASSLPNDSTLLQVAKRAWKKLSLLVLSSTAQQEVCELLKQLGYHAVLEGSTPAQGMERLRVDVMVSRTPEGKSCSIAVEFDGPTHFLLQPARVYDGSSALRHRQLQRRVSSLLSVPYWDWQSLGAAVDGSDKKLEYLREQMQALHI